MYCLNDNSAVILTPSRMRGESPARGPPVGESFDSVEEKSLVNASILNASLISGHSMSSVSAPSVDSASTEVSRKLPEQVSIPTHFVTEQAKQYARSHWRHEESESLIYELETVLDSQEDGRNFSTVIAVEEEVNPMGIVTKGKLSAEICDMDLRTVSTASISKDDSTTKEDEQDEIEKSRNVDMDYLSETSKESPAYDADAESNGRTKLANQQGALVSQDQPLVQPEVVASPSQEKSKEDDNPEEAASVFSIMSAVGVPRMLAFFHRDEKRSEGRGRRLAKRSDTKAFLLQQQKEVELEDKVQAIQAKILKAQKELTSEAVQTKASFKARIARLNGTLHQEATVIEQIERELGHAKWENPKAKLHREELMLAIRKTNNEILLKCIQHNLCADLNWAMASRIRENFKGLRCEDEMNLVHDSLSKVQAMVDTLVEKKLSSSERDEMEIMIMTDQAMSKFRMLNKV